MFTEHETILSQQISLRYPRASTFNNLLFAAISSHLAGTLNLPAINACSRSPSTLSFRWIHFLSKIAESWLVQPLVQSSKFSWICLRKNPFFAGYSFCSPLLNTSRRSIRIMKKSSLHESAIVKLGQITFLSFSITHCIYITLSLQKLRWLVTGSAFPSGGFYHENPGSVSMAAKIRLVFNSRAFRFL
ncbi:MAG: hypothetical protein ACLTF6_13645 [Clostridium sp.]